LNCVNVVIQNSMIEDLYACLLDTSKDTFRMWDPKMRSIHVTCDISWLDRILERLFLKIPDGYDDLKTESENL
jgi:hypothetical protein